MTGLSLTCFLLGKKNGELYQFSLIFLTVTPAFCGNYFSFPYFSRDAKSFIYPTQYYISFYVSKLNVKG